MRRLEVGKAYLPGAQFADGTARLGYGGGQFELAFFLSSPTRDELADYRTGPASFGVVLWNVPRSSPLFLLYRFGRQPVSDVPFSIRLQPDAPPPILPAGRRLMLPCILVDAATGIVRVIRAVTLHADTTAELAAALAAQIEQPFDAAEYDRQLSAVYSAHTSAELADKAHMLPGGR